MEIKGDKGCEDCEGYQKEIERLNEEVKLELWRLSRLEIFRKEAEEREKRLKEKHEKIKQELDKTTPELTKLKFVKIIHKGIKKYVNIRTHLTVYGYIRAHFDEYEYPSSISMLCLMYFLRIFDKYTSNITVSGDNNQTITSNDWRIGYGYGSFWIHSLSKTIIKYKILVNRQSAIEYKSNNTIGITRKDKYLVNESMNYHKDNNIFYDLMNDGVVVAYESERREPIYRVGNDDKKLDVFQQGDIITMELNLIHGVLKFYVNDDSKGISVNIKQNENIKYKFFIAILGKNDSFSVIDYCEVVT